MYDVILYNAQYSTNPPYLGDSPTHMVISSRSVEKLEAVARQCQELSPKSTVVVLPIDMSDLTEEDGGSLEKYMTSLRSMLKENSLGGIDCLISNAGVSSRGTALATPQAVLHSVMNVNFFGPVALTKAIAKDMCVRATGGSISVISSVQGKIGLPMRTSYASSKHALQGYCDSLRGELAGYGISVTVVSPGYIHTELSMNAITATGKKYGVTDDTTRNGMIPSTAAHQTLLAIATQVSDCVLADAKTVAAIQGKTQFPELMVKYMNSRAKKTMTSS